MEDKITIERIKLLHPAIRYEVLDLYKNEVVPALTNATCRFAYTLRTFQEQNILYSKGRSKLFDSKGNRLGIVTNAKGGQSFHNYGLSFDFLLLNNHIAHWNTTIDFDNDGMADWMEVVNIFRKEGWEWGGNWRKKDYPHLQKTFGYSWQELLAKYNNGEFLPHPNDKYLRL